VTNAGDQINFRSLGELSIGCVSLAGLFKPVSEAQAVATLQAALDANIGHFDTAPYYGLGRAEHLLGDVLRGREGRPILSTKVGRLLRPYHGTEDPRDNWANPYPFEAVYDYTYDGIMRSFEDSLQRLGLSEVDILYVHDLGRMVHGPVHSQQYWRQLVDGGYRALTELKQSGDIKAIGLGVNEFEVLMDAMALGEWDAFLLAGRYTLLDQSALEPCLTACLSRGIPVVCAAPFNGGALMGNGTWNYASGPSHVAERVRAIEAACAKFDVHVGAAALQFPLAHPAIVTVLAGPKSPAEFQQLQRWMGELIPVEFWAYLVTQNLIAGAAPTPRTTARDARC
jgi:D-threo-aldose 1-dehydrogenase